MGKDLSDHVYMPFVRSFEQRSRPILQKQIYNDVITFFMIIFVKNFWTDKIDLWFCLRIMYVEGSFNFFLSN